MAQMTGSTFLESINQMVDRAAQVLDLDPEISEAPIMPIYLPLVIK